MIEQYQEEIKQNIAWITELQQVLFWVNEPNEFLNFAERVNAVSAEDLKRTSKELLSNDHLKIGTYPQK